MRDLEIITKQISAVLSLLCQIEEKVAAIELRTHSRAERNTTVKNQPKLKTISPEDFD